MSTPVTPNQVVILLLAAVAVGLITALFARLDDAARRMVTVRVRASRAWRRRRDG